MSRKPLTDFLCAINIPQPVLFPFLFVKTGFSAGDTSPTGHVTEVSFFFVPLRIQSTSSQFPELSLRAVATFHAGDAAKLVFSQIDEKRESEREKKNRALTRMEKSSRVPAVTDWSRRMVAAVGAREERVADLS